MKDVQHFGRHWRPRIGCPKCGQLTDLMHPDAVTVAEDRKTATVNEDRSVSCRNEGCGAKLPKGIPLRYAPPEPRER